MCYGDPEFGRDGYYKRWLEEWEREEQEKQALEHYAQEHGIETE